MVTFLTGTYFTAKKEYIYSEISSLLDKGERVYLIVPEQASFDRDRDFLLCFGEEKANKLTVSSFTHLSRDVLEENGLRVKPEADEAARNVLMSIAVEECADDLHIYGKYSHKLSLVEKLLGEYVEIRQSGLEINALSQLKSKLPDGKLRQKAEDLFRIFSVYEALVGQRFSEATDNIRVMTEFLRENRIFEGAYIFFDDFRGFTGAQVRLITEMISQAEKAYISVFAPDTVSYYGNEAYHHAVRNCRKLRNSASARGISFCEKKIDKQNPNEAMHHLSDNLFSSEKEVYEKSTDAITVFCADDKYSECDAAAVYIKNLLKKGYRCRNISVCERNSDYLKTMVAALKKYSVPVFEDKRVPLFEYPLIKAVLYAVNIASYGLKTDEIFSYIKTGMSGIGIEQCAELENYVFIWGISGNGWTKSFKGHPEGFGEKETPSSTERLQNINEIRSKVISPLVTLKHKLENNNGENSCKAVFEFLTEIKAADNFREYACFLHDSGNEAQAVECSAVWDILTESLDALYEAVSGRSISAPRFYELLKIILSSSEVGRIPAGIDEIVLGSAGRTRHLEPEAVIVLGCNDGVFPKTASGGGLFSSAERRILSSNDFPLENIPENNYSEERMIAYSVLTGAKDKLYVSYSKLSSEGNEQAPSEIVEEIRTLFPLCVSGNDKKLSSIDKIGSLESAFEECAAFYRENSVYSASLKKFIEGSSLAHRFSAVKAAVENLPAKIENTETATALFSKDMYISPSKAEVFHSCAFRYFCQYGINLRKPRKADLDARINGLLIHHLLENILVRKTNKELSDMNETALRSLISDITEEFITEYMGGREDKGVLLNRNLDRTKQTAFAILMRMVKEFALSRFETADVELSISEDGDIKPYKISLSDGGSITVSGKVDRVDIMKMNEKAYLRVVDYKTGGKDFKLSDVYDGLNMQMLIYLMCLWDNGKERYGDVVPAGIMYVPANNSGEMLSRNADSESVELQKLLNGRMNGMILEDGDVLEGMEKGCKGRFINAYIDEKGNMKGTFLSLNGFRALHKKIDDILSDMGVSLHNGYIEALPIIGTSSYKNTCEYCDYKDICKRDEDAPVKEPLNLTHKKSVELLKGE